VDARVTPVVASRRLVDGVSVRDVAELVLAADLVRERPQSLFPAGEQNAVPTARRQQARDLGADSRRASGNNG
jgi:hypothetical protein